MYFSIPSYDILTVRTPEEYSHYDKREDFIISSKLLA